MNKDVIYIEPEDDITDIITKIENSKEKIVAIVPPKKAGVFRSIVNIKLIAKSGLNAEKAVVLVTTDPSIVKLAAVTKLPVTKNLKSAPAVPEAEDIAEIEKTASETIVDTDSGGDEELVEADEAEILEDEAEPAKKVPADNKKEEIKEESKKEKVAEEKIQEAKDDSAKDDKKATKKEKKLSSNPVIAWIQKHKVITICGGVGLVVLILVLIWANVIAPAVTIYVSIRTDTDPFSESVTFTDKLTDEDISKGVFYLEEKKIESKEEVEFEATGKKNVGQKASGDVVVYAYFREQGSIPVNAGTIFTHDGLNYIAQDGATLVMNSSTNCENTSPAELALSGCLVSARVAVLAEASGSSYNLAATSSGWSTVAPVSVYSDKAISGGTDETITVVQQSDIDSAIEKLNKTDSNAIKEKLLASVEEGDFVIETSFKQTVSDPVSTPAIGEQVKEGEKAKLTVTTTDTIFVIDDVKVEEFIKEKAKLKNNYIIYQINNPFIENFTKTDSGYIGKLKASYQSGPEVTAKDVVEIVMGKGLGTGRDDLTKAYSGISKVTTEVSFPWVSSFPNNEEKITVNIEVEEKQK